MQRYLSTRRAVLQHGLGVVTVGLAVALAGCGSDGGDDGEPTETTSTDTPTETSTETETETETETAGDDQLEVFDATGTAITEDGIGQIELTVTRTPSSDPIDLRDVSIVYSGRTTTATLWHEATTGSESRVFATTPLAETDGIDRTLDEPGEEHLLTIDLTQNAIDERMGSSVRARVELGVEGGQTTTVQLEAPGSLADRDSVPL